MNLERERGVFMLTNETIALMNLSMKEYRRDMLMKLHIRKSIFLSKTECIKSDDLRSYG